MFSTDPTKFFGCELGAQTQFDTKNDRYIVNGSHEANKLQDMLDGFIRKFVLCPECDNPETDLVTLSLRVGGRGFEEAARRSRYDTAARFPSSAVRVCLSSSMSTPRNKPSATLVRPVDIAACLTPDTNSARSSLKTHQVSLPVASRHRAACADRRASISPLNRSPLNRSPFPREQRAPTVGPLL